MKIIDPESLLKKYQSGECTPEEAALVEYYYINGDFKVPVLSESELTLSAQRVILNVQNLTKLKKITFKLWQKIIIATAAMLVVLGVWTLLFTNNTNLPKNYANDVKPGSNQATLTLPDGTTIKLNEAKNGELATDHGVRIIKEADGQLLYQFNTDVKATPTRDSIAALVSVNEIPSNPLKGLNSLTTPKGGQYHIALPDGTNVWINAGSTLRFPSTFEGLTERRVLLIGEAYFEVAQVKSVFGMKKRARKKPFIVKTAAQEVTVLGTHFNINSYADEPDIKTTLLEGSVSISAPLLQEGGTILKPGDQGINDHSEIKVKTVDTDLAVAWKNGKFMFRNETLESLMRRISRWYNVEVSYENKELRGLVFGGVISKYDNISKVLCVLEATGDVHFKIDGRRITATR